MLHIHRAERADGLADALGELLAAPLADPFAPEVVSVPTRGMERWLSQRLSASLGASPGRRDGVCANVLFPTPRRLIGDAIAAASGVDPDSDPWLPERAVWPLLEVVGDALGRPWLQKLSTHLGYGDDEPDPVKQTRRLSVVRHLAELFDRYSLHRPEMVRAWAAGDFPAATATDAAWQARLWCALRERIGLPGPAERLETACAALREDGSCLELPPRVALFGLTRLPSGDLQLLRALAAERDVHLLLLHPSPALWEAVTRIAGDAPGIKLRKTDPTADTPSNDLLTSWGRDAREMQLVLGASDEYADHHHPLQFGGDTLLHRIQADVRADRSPPGAPFPGHDDERPLLGPADRSLQVHACHGRARQVEVLRDAILHLLAADPTLEPRDVIVMCPDIETFAPLIQATFGAGEVTPEDTAPDTVEEAKAVDLRVRLADRSLRQTNGVLAVVAELLDLVPERITASQVLDFADRDPVRRRFRIDDDDLTRLQSWIEDAGIRWGLDAEHRAPFKLDRLPTGTWRSGLDRLLLGVAMTEDRHRLWSGVLPLDDVDSGVIDLAGRFAELVARLGEAIDALSTDKPIEAWAQAIADAADALTATGPRDSWQRLELQRILEQMVAEATFAGAAVDSDVALAEVRALLTDRLAGRPTRANFRTGHLTVCTLYPMRSVPHRVVCLLGLDDGAFPRKSPRDGDDLMLDDPHIGERDPRSEDRQLLLDALLAATDHLVITYAGNDERTNIRRPPAVPVGELLDVVDATVRTEAGLARERIEVRHPLQPFDTRNFDPGALVPDLTWSFDWTTLEGARALVGPRSENGSFLPEPLPALDSKLVELDDLVRFVGHPLRAFLRQRLRISLSDVSDEIEDGLAVELDGLRRWGVGQRLLEACLAGTDGRTAILAEIARGTLPPGRLGHPVINQLYPIVEGILTEARALMPAGAEPEPVDVHVELPDGRLLTGTVSAIGDLLLQSSYSRVAAKHRLSSWVRFLAATATHPERGFAAATVGRARGYGTVTISRIAPFAGEPEHRRWLALEHLRALIELYDRGMREPLPIYCATSAAYAHAASTEEDAAAAAGEAWTSRYKFDGEDAELEHPLVLGGVRGIEELLIEAPHADERGPGWQMSETSRFGRLARRLWDGPLSCEEVTTL
ncbi:MAG: exodeoxyribonuclease V subunit gamma [Solirubrobacteraceae bacterium]